MKKFTVIVILVVLLGVTYIFYQSKQMEKHRTLEENKKEAMNLLQDNLEKFNPVLAAFVDEEYKTVIGSDINAKGIFTMERGLARNQDPIGNYVVKYDLNNMEVISKRLNIHNDKYAEEWRAFEEVPGG